MTSSSSYILGTDALGNDIVTICVGLQPQRKKFTVHKKLICDRSDYFSKAFNGRFKESIESEICLEEDDPDAFDLFVNWLYRGRLPVLDAEALEDQEPDEYDKDTAEEDAQKALAIKPTWAKLKKEKEHSSGKGFVNGEATDHDSTDDDATDGDATDADHKAEGDEANSDDGTYDGIHTTPKA